MKKMIQLTPQQINFLLTMGDRYKDGPDEYLRLPFWFKRTSGCNDMFEIVSEEDALKFINPLPTK